MIIIAPLFVVQNKKGAHPSTGAAPRIPSGTAAPGAPLSLLLIGRITLSRHINVSEVLEIITHPRECSVLYIVGKGLGFVQVNEGIVAIR